LRRQYCGALFAIVLLLGACGKPVARPASTPTTSTAPTTSNNAVITAKSQRVLEGAIKAGGPACSAAVGFKGTVVWTGVLGVADTATGAKITPDTVFDIGSVSKQFTATAVLLLADKGKLTLDDPLSKYLPEFPKWATTVTVGELIHQRHPRVRGAARVARVQFSDRTTQDQALQALAAVANLHFKPGTNSHTPDPIICCSARSSIGFRESRCRSSSAPTYFVHSTWPW
jgi:CubicO group peptidase (beta-lactamase class C family)